MAMQIPGIELSTSMFYRNNYNASHALSVENPLGSWTSSTRGIFFRTLSVLDTVRRGRRPELFVKLTVGSKPTVFHDGVRLIGRILWHLSN